MTEPSRRTWKDALSSALAGASRVVVCGIGNDMRGDDAAGVLCLRSLKRFLSSSGLNRGNLLLLDGGETPENETSAVRAFEPDLVVLIDAARFGRDPGSVFVVDKDAIADDEVSTHRISLSLLVRYFEDSIGTAVLFIGIEPLSTEAGREVSPVVKKAIGELSGALASHLAKK